MGQLDLGCPTSAGIGAPFPVETVPQLPSGIVPHFDRNQQLRRNEMMETK